MRRWKSTLALGFYTQIHRHEGCRVILQPPEGVSEPRGYRVVRVLIRAYVHLYPRQMTSSVVWKKCRSKTCKPLSYANPFWALTHWRFFSFFFSIMCLWLSLWLGVLKVVYHLGGFYVFNSWNLFACLTYSLFLCLLPCPCNLFII